MMFAQYCRVESIAGGVHASGRDMIRAARTMLAPTGKLRAQREARHEWLRDMLIMHHESRAEYASVVCARRIKPITPAERDQRIRRNMYHS
jgi:hypothetical protein